jgi:hypothetical protein
MFIFILDRTFSICRTTAHARVNLALGGELVLQASDTGALFAR